MYKKISEELVSFIKKSPTAFHAVETIKGLLLEEGYAELLEGQSWDIEEGKKYFVVRNQSSIIALNIGEDLEHYSFNIAASHSDSPTFKIKDNAEIHIRNKYVQLNTEGYGGMIASTWLDRPLSVAGRVLVEEDHRYASRLVNIDRDLLMIPNQSIHMNRSINDKYAFNKQIDMVPLFGGCDTQAGDFKKLIAEYTNVDEDKIVGSDLYLYSRIAPSIWGANEEYVSSGRLDDLQCAFASLVGFLKGSNKKSINVFACFDNEEVGSATKQGAASTFMYDVLKRVNTALLKTEEEFYRAIASSLMLSADNAHAVHPNHPAKSDVTNCVYMNEGVVVKTHAGMKYTSDGVSIALVRGFAKKAGIPLQIFANRSDVLGGSTLGYIAMNQISMNCVDVGVGQLAMHSSYETAGIKDTCYLILLMEEFFNSHIEQTGMCEYSVYKD